MRPTNVECYSTAMTGVLMSLGVQWGLVKEGHTLSSTWVCVKLGKPYKWESAFLLVSLAKQKSHTFEGPRRVFSPCFQSVFSLDVIAMTWAGFCKLLVLDFNQMICGYLL